MAPALSTVATTRPPRSTVMRSETSSTSCSLCEMKTIALPSFAITRRVAKSSRASCGVSTAVGSSRIRTRASRCRALRISTRCCSPTESCQILARGSTASPKYSASTCDARLERLAVEHEAPVALVAERDVLGHGERLHEAEVLVHHAHAARERVPRRAQLDGLAVQLERSLVGPVEARDDVRERALARAVLAQQRVHLAGADLEVDAGVCDDAGEALRDAPQRHRRYGSGDAAGIVHGWTVSPSGSRRRP